MKLTMRSMSVLVTLLMILGQGELLMTGAAKIVCALKNANTDCKMNNKLKCSNGNVINITNVFYKIPTNTNTNCSCIQKKINTTIESHVKKACNNNASCKISKTDLYSNSGRYFIKYQCIGAITPTKSTATQPIQDHLVKTEAQTGSDDIPIVSIVAPVAIAVVLALVIIAVVFIVRFKRKKNRNHDGIYGDGDQNNSDNHESFSNPAYVSDGLNNISSKPSRSVERTSSFSQDSGYAECQDVDAIDANDGEYNTITFNQTASNVDEAYSHIPKQPEMVDNTYSHLTPERNTQSGASNYSHVNTENTGMQLKINVNESTYNTLQTQAPNKHPKCHSVTDDMPENEYNHANFGPMSSKQDGIKTEYYNLNTPTKAIMHASSSISPNPNDAEVVKKQHKLDISADNGHTYFVLEKGEDGTEQDKKEEDSSENIAHTYFVLEEDPVNANADVVADSTQHDYFVLIKQ